MLTYAPNMVPAPVLLPDGNTLYAGETTSVISEPLIDLLGPTADGTDDPAGYGGSQCSTAASVRHELRSDRGPLLVQYTCPLAKQVWCCEEGKRALSAGWFSTPTTGRQP